MTGNGKLNKHQNYGLTDSSFKFEVDGDPYIPFTDMSNDEKIDNEQEKVAFIERKDTLQFISIFFKINP